MTSTRRAPGEDIIAWAVRTGRIDAASSGAYRERLTAGTVTEAAITALAAVDPALLVAPVPARTGRFDLAAATAAPTGAAVFGRNPVVAAAAARDVHAYTAAAAKAAPPTLFAGGDLPPFTASGIDPAKLLSVPWQARHAIAAAPTTGEAYRLQQDYSGPGAEDIAALEQGEHPGNLDYQRRAEQWLVDGMSNDELYGGLFGQTRDAAEDAEGSGYVFRPAKGV